ncbi:hypothetical protein KAR91_81985, partial [Candidatus Pacearchaeota archaeon]|nr:hypothetical protein [Candidatus Pacearchaeota archaeon]
REFLRARPNYIFVFGDNLERRGTGGAAALRDEPNTYGFITKKTPTHDSAAYFTPEEYAEIFKHEYAKLSMAIQYNGDENTKYLISKVGSELANKFGIFEEVIHPRILDLDRHPNAIFLW